MRYEVPVYRYEKLEKMIKRAQNKGGNISISTIREFDKTFDVCINDDTSRTSRTVDVVAKCYEVEVDGSYKINGWSFVATIEHTPNGNIIRCIDSSLESLIPNKYLTCGPECEHCHRVRNRKDTYLVYNEETKEFKQVGKTCLFDFTNGLTPETCEAFASVFNYCESCEEFDEDEFLGGFSNSIDYGFSNNDVKKYAYSLVKKFGYESNGKSSAKLEQCLFKGSNNEYDVVKASDEDIEAVDEFAQSIDDESVGYMRNAKLAWLNSYASYRDFALICSFVSTYFRNIERITKEKHNRESSNYIGNIGDKITINVEKMRALYTKKHYYGYNNVAYTVVYEITDDNGNIFIWSSSNVIEDGVKKLSGTVKDHKEYKGIKQTVLTRCKVVY